jgi:hypothetical protein
MSDKDYHSALVRRFYLLHPRSPIIDQEGRHFTTGCPRAILLFKDFCTFGTMLVVVRLVKTATFFERMMRLKADVWS